MQLSKSMGVRSSIKQIASNLRFPEGPVALSDGSFLVVEMAGGCLTHLDADGTTITTVMLGGGPNGAAMGPDGLVYVCNNGGQNWLSNARGLVPAGQARDYDGGRIERVDIATGLSELVVSHGPEGSLKGPNDLVFDRTGGLWFTDMGKTRSRDMDRGGLYYLGAGSRDLAEAVFPMAQPNGIALSADETVLFVAETLTGRIWAFDLPEPGRIAPVHDLAPHGGRLVATLPDYRLPDSMTVDAEGHLCIATLMRGGVTRLNPDDGGMEHFDMPDRFTTNICFGGEGLSTAYVTLSESGRLVAIDWPAAGQPLNFVNLPARTISVPEYVG